MQSRIWSATSPVPFWIIFTQAYEDACGVATLAAAVNFFARAETVLPAKGVP